MKRIYLLLLAIVGIGTSHAQTTVSIDRDSLTVASLYVGWNAPIGAPAEMHNNVLTSMEFMMTYGRRFYFGKDDRYALALQGGLDWKNVRMPGSECWFAKDYGNDNVIIAPIDYDVKASFSRIRTFSIVAPVMLEINYEKRRKLVVGPMFSYVPFATIYAEYSMNDSDVDFSERIGGIHQNKWSVDLMAQYIRKNIGFYVKYSPVNVLHSDRAPGFTSLTFGVLLTN